LFVTKRRADRMEGKKGKKIWEKLISLLSTTHLTFLRKEGGVMGNESFKRFRTRRNRKNVVRV